MAYIAYARVSTIEQNEGRQLEAFRLFPHTIERVYLEKISGKNADRPELKKMLDFLREGDTLVIADLSRLARSTRDLLAIVDLLNEKHVQLVSLKENIDTVTPSGKFTLTIFAALSELERETILERQREGIALAKKEGRYLGRKPAPYDEALFLSECEKWLSGKQSAVYTMEKVGMKPNRFYRKVNEYGLREKGGRFGREEK